MSTKGARGLGGVGEAFAECIPCGEPKVKINLVHQAIGPVLSGTNLTCFDSYQLFLVHNDSARVLKQ